MINQAITENDLIGGWQLQQWSIIQADQTSHPYGVNAIGQLMYTADGHMSAIICNPDCPSIPQGSLRKLGVEQRALLLDHSFSYAGRWELVRDMSNDIVVHHVQVSQNPNFIGSEQRRHATLDSDRLTLSAEEAMPSGPSRLHQLIWLRA